MFVCIVYELIWISMGLHEQGDEGEGNIMPVHLNPVCFGIYGGHNNILIV